MRFIRKTLHKYYLHFQCSNSRNHLANLRVDNDNIARPNAKQAIIYCISNMCTNIFNDLAQGNYGKIRTPLLFVWGNMQHALQSM